MKITLMAALLAAAMALSGCASKFRTYDGPEVTRIVVHKDSRRMYLMHYDPALAGFDIEAGTSLVVWTSGGRKVVLDRVALRIRDVNQLRDALVKWLAAARRTP